MIWGDEVVIVSRHKATIDYLLDKLSEIGYEGKVTIIDHLTSDFIEKIDGNVTIIGNMRIDQIFKLVNKGFQVIITVLKLPKELRGKEIGKEELDKYLYFYEVLDIYIREWGW